jgi:histidinol-phosphate aminotransferase
MSGPVPLPGILNIAPYIGGEAKADATRLIRLASNESSFGPSPRAVQAYIRLATDLHRYPDGGCQILREALGYHYGLDPTRIVCGAGSDELIALLIKSYAGPGNEVLRSAHGFLMYEISARAAGAVPIAAPETNLCCNVDAVLDQIGPRTRLVFLANPNNPTGSFLTKAEISRLHAGLPERVLLVIDAAYAEYVDRRDYSAGIELVDRSVNVVMLRTFSKIYGLASLRLGWAYCPTVVADVLNRVRGPFNVGAPAQTAGAAALGDIHFVKASQIHNTAWRDWTSAQLQALGLTVYPSIGNFLLVDFAQQPNRDAETARLFLKQRGILVRQMNAYGLPSCLRFGIGTAEEMPEAVLTVAEYLGA